MKHLMVDLETMARSARAAIVQLGAVVFDPATGEVGERFHADVSLASNAACGREMEPDTILWWMGQEKPPRPDDTPERLAELRAEKDAARAAFLRGQSRSVDLIEALAAFFSWLETHFESPDDIAGVWAQGANFDIPILQDAIVQLAGEHAIPWRYNAPRDIRTIFWLLDPEDPSGKKVFARIPIGDEVKHSASSDAFRQAVALSSALRQLVTTLPR